MILPSLSEGLGIAIVEGFRERTPVLSSSIEPFRELITDGETGFIFDTTPESLHQKLNEIMTLTVEQTNKISDKAYAIYNNSFTLDTMIEHYQKVYETLR